MGLLRQVARQHSRPFPWPPSRPVTTCAIRETVFLPRTSRRPIPSSTHTRWACRSRILQLYPWAGLRRVFPVRRAFRQQSLPAQQPVRRPPCRHHIIRREALIVIRPGWSAPGAKDHTRRFVPDKHVMSCRLRRGLLLSVARRDVQFRVSLRVDAGLQPAVVEFLVLCEDEPVPDERGGKAGEGTGSLSEEGSQVSRRAEQWGCLGAEGDDAGRGIRRWFRSRVGGGKEEKGGHRLGSGRCLER